MFLLSDNPWGDFPTWMLAIIAIPTLIISCITLLQEKRIKELTDVVIELQNQTKELKVQSDIFLKRYELELLLSAKRRMPVFEMQSFYKSTSVGIYILCLNNDGILATDVAIFNLKWDKRFVQYIRVPSEADINQGREMVFNIDTIQLSLARELISFSFTLIFGDGRNNNFSQSVTCEKGIVKVGLPQTVDDQPQ